jgi:CTP:molybdopterin cytidylyltransferase MocA
MTVAAVVLVPDPVVALSDADGQPVIRRVVQAAWAGGAMPIVVVAGRTAEADSVGEAIAGLPASFIQPDAPPGARWFAAGIATAEAHVRETTAALLWPCRFAWIDPETATSLIEAAGAAPGAIVRAAYEGRSGFPIAVPASLTDRFAGERELHAYQLVETMESAGQKVRVLELGDPGIVDDVSVPRSQLPPYHGPPEPAAGTPPEWNDELARHAARSSAGG